VFGRYGYWAHIGRVKSKFSTLDKSKNYQFFDLKFNQKIDNLG